MDCLLLPSFPPSQNGQVYFLNSGSAAAVVAARIRRLKDHFLPSSSSYPLKLRLSCCLHLLFPVDITYAVAAPPPSRRRSLLSSSPANFSPAAFPNFFVFQFVALSFQQLLVLYCHRLTPLVPLPLSPSSDKS